MVEAREVVEAGTDGAHRRKSHPAESLQRIEHSEPPENLRAARENDVGRDGVRRERALVEEQNLESLAPQYDRGGATGDARADDDGVEDVMRNHGCESY